MGQGPPSSWRLVFAEVAGGKGVGAGLDLCPAMFGFSHSI